MAKVKENYVGAIDVGTHKCRALIGISRSNGELEIIGFGETLTESAVVKGDIQNLELLQEKISDALNQAENMAQISFADIYSATINISGSSVSFIDSIGSVTIKNSDGRITEDDYDEACENAERCNIPVGKTNFGTCISYACINNSKKVINPIGQAANKLDLHALIHCVGASEFKDISLLIDDLGLDENRIDKIFSGLAAMYGVLSENERKNGTLLVDFGAGTTEYLAVNNYGIMTEGVLPVGFEHVINDLSIGLKVPASVVRKLVESGKLEQLLTNKEDFLTCEYNHSTQKFPLHTVENIVNDRLQELFTIIKNEIYKKNCHLDINTGGILIGGGALLSRSQEVFREVFNFNTSIGKANDMTGIIGNLQTPPYGTTYGLLRLAHMCCVGNELPSKANNPLTTAVDKIIYFYKRVKDSIKL